MTTQKTPKAFPRRLRQGGSTVIGFLIGLICGLAVAVAVAIFVTKAPIPFVNKSPRSSERTLEPKAGAELPDPNKTLQSKAGKPAQPEAPAAPAAGSAPDAKDEPKDEKKDSILGLLGTIGGAVSGDAKPPATPSAPALPSAPIVAATKPVEPKAADSKAADSKAPVGDGKAGDAKTAKATYMLQVGSFVSTADAESRKLKLALAGIEAKVVQADVDGKTVYRVRTGPYKDFDDMNKARSKITESGFDVSIARQ